ncbi:MAG: hypothetical protein IJV00_05325 [Clostridia bacterium]|nr:hypothetical protein [Clostridia bacterium]
MIKRSLFLPDDGLCNPFFDPPASIWAYRLIIPQISKKVNVFFRLIFASVQDQPDFSPSGFARDRREARVLKEVVSGFDLHFVVEKRRKTQKSVKIRAFSAIRPLLGFSKDVSEQFRFVYNFENLHFFVEVAQTKLLFFGQIAEISLVFKNL